MKRKILFWLFATITAGSLIAGLILPRTALNFTICWAIGVVSSMAATGVRVSILLNDLSKRK